MLLGSVWTENCGLWVPKVNSSEQLPYALRRLGPEGGAERGNFQPRREGLEDRPAGWPALLILESCGLVCLPSSLPGQMGYVTVTVSVG